MKRHSLIFLITFTVFTLTTLHGHTMFPPYTNVLHPDSGPIEVIDQEQSLFCGTLETYGKGKIAQSFIPTLDKLTKIDIRLQREGNPDSIIISIRDDLHNTDIDSVTISGEDIDTQGQWLEIQFEDSLFLTINNPAYIILYPQGTTSNDQFCLSFQDKNPFVSHRFPLAIGDDS